MVISPTIFFAEYGGQESDKGCINRIEVTQATVVDERIIYRPCRRSRLCRGRSG
ncbi:Alanyl tRNA synthetase related protein [Pseudomonas savastanoi pv. glycinea]|uniref:Alanyl tRNA synthetase related protein n=1 Tax=Pseudomonas savastanoi pv. glycinea TaxID=318 RepID=A0ABR5L4K7_PSESG|nr:Alanyl tRNA synthetase related protein [Pseudomonas syringae pv. maculicola]KPC24580.1 Alanyl tRNA synthetase related protein [Pseudomonas savastanoi pv. glycinea]KPC30644.1 Alanyl tRNA synthetase related protein [Pseudomonas savastanoi pv. glycinea]KPC39485.1 Alanyl tRNA synthetase related protein [Pseudomonas savastanoi pv. glycinea]KPC39590.1 Alanyl tRNA synthetase related protein [Pseudomonas savastanoi pv. glycinea]